jgi:hypothetical protein
MYCSVPSCLQPSSGVCRQLTLRALSLKVLHASSNRTQLVTRQSQLQRNHFLLLSISDLLLSSGNLTGRPYEECPPQPLACFKRPQSYSFWELLEGRPALIWSSHLLGLFGCTHKISNIPPNSRSPGVPLSQG